MAVCMVGVGAGYVIWEALYETFTQQVPESVLLAVSESSAFATICGLAGTLVVLGIGLGLALIGGEVFNKVVERRATGRPEESR